jgi:hypothetical protein
METMLPLSEPVYTALMAEIKKTGTTPDDWVKQHLPRRRPEPTPEEVAEDNARLFACVSDEPCGSLDNESIDADLAREYGDNHEPRPNTSGADR